MKSLLKSQKNNEQPLARRGAPLPSNLTVDVGNKTDSIHRIGGALPPPAPPRPAKHKSEPKPKLMAKLKGEKDLNPLSVQVPATTASSSANSCSPRKPPGFRSSWILNLVSFFFNNL